MTAKKRPVKQEPLLNTVARKLGRAAGAFTKVTQELRENLSSLPESVAKKVRNASNIGSHGKPSRVRTRHRTRHPRETSHRAARGQSTKRTATGKRKLPKDESMRSKRKSINRRALPQ